MVNSDLRGTAVVGVDFGTATSPYSHYPR